ncbi:MAG: hypothetical protein ABL952_13530 [Pyrinomonadaceae bacterium]
MSTNFYWILWLVFGVAAGAFWLSGFFGMVTVVAFGFVATGLIFMGFMCVLPAVAAREQVKTTKPERKTQSSSARRAVRLGLAYGR